MSKWNPHPDWQAGRRAEGRGSYLSSQPARRANYRKMRIADSLKYVQ